jgi:UDP-2,3-diacylglucosamine pyrophosphatase LpxH
MKLIVSDLHVGDNKSGHQDFYNLLVAMPEVEELIIAGDLLDFWVSRLDRCLDTAGYLLDYIVKRFGNKWTYLLGNHDEDIMALQSIFGNVCFDLNLTFQDKKVRVLHGHTLDPDPYVKTRLARTNAWLVNKTDQWFNMDMRKFLVSLSGYSGNNLYYELLLKDYEKSLVDTFKGKYDVVITGHTHAPCIKDLGGIGYINLGDAMQHRTCVIVRSDESGFDLIDYTTPDYKIIDSYIGESRVLP